MRNHRGFRADGEPLAWVLSQPARIVGMAVVRSLDSSYDRWSTSILRIYGSYCWPTEQLVDGAAAAIVAERSAKYAP